MPQPQPQPQPQLSNCAAQDGARRWVDASLARLVCILGAVFATSLGYAGRTDIDWMARSERAPLIDATGGLERVDDGRPVPMPVTGPGAKQAALAADMRIASHDEAKALLQGSGLSEGSDAGAGRATIAGLLDRLLIPRPASASPASHPHGVGTAELDCALFTGSVGVRRLLGATEVHKAGESAGRESAMGLDLPIHCLAAAPYAALPAVAKRALPPAADQSVRGAGLQLGRMFDTWIKPRSRWWLALAGAAALMVMFGLAVGARAIARRRERDKARRLISRYPAHKARRRAGGRASKGQWF